MKKKYNAELIEIYNVYASTVEFTRHKNLREVYDDGKFDVVDYYGNKVDLDEVAEELAYALLNKIKIPKEHFEAGNLYKMFNTDDGVGCCYVRCTDESKPEFVNIETHEVYSVGMYFRCNEADVIRFDEGFVFADNKWHNV